MDLSPFEGILCDIGGVLYVGDTPVDGAIAAVAALKGRFPVRFLTNTTQRTGAQVVRKLRDFGFDIEAEEVITALDVTHQWLQHKQSSAYLLLTDEVKPTFDDLSAYPCRYVVVGDAQENFTYAGLNGAFRVLNAGGELLAAAKNRCFMDRDGLSLDAGGFVAALEYASCQTAHIIGKPSRDFYHLACEAAGISPEKALMIGDDIEGDVKGAQDAGIRAVLVRTGKFRPRDLECGITPDYLLGSIADVP